MIKSILIFGIMICIFNDNKLKAQSFYFDTNQVSLIKTTGNSPAHWYIQIFSNELNDKILRWKTSFSHIPDEWVIGFDDQTTNDLSILDGDSADFTLFATPEVTQKLIISAFTNDTPGNGTVSFEIYDPLNPGDRDTIHYSFIITQENLEVNFIDEREVFNIENGKIRILNKQLADVKVYNLQGQQLFYEQSVKEFNLNKLPEQELCFIQVVSNNRFYFVKLLK